MRRVVHFVVNLTLPFLLCLSLSCSEFEDEKEEDGTQEASIDEQTPEPGSPATKTDVIPQEGAVSGYLLTPEQHSENLFKALEVRLGWQDEDHDRFVDLVKTQLAVPLGGVDFRTQSIRDRFPKVQTQLIVRQMAWHAASWVIWREVDPNHPQPGSIFKHCNIHEDRPLLAGEKSMEGTERNRLNEGAVRWQRQLEEFYWKILTRPPTKEEVDLLTTHYLEAISHHQYWPPAGWTVVLYALLSGAEYWNL